MARPTQLKPLIDTAHALGLQVFLDVVYNHFGPDGNYLHPYARTFFRDDLDTPWGAAIDFRRPEVRDFFIENALYWLNEYHFDGLRLDAVHAILSRTGCRNWRRHPRPHPARPPCAPGRWSTRTMRPPDAVSLRRAVERRRPPCAACAADRRDRRLLRRLCRRHRRQAGRCLDQGFVYQGEPSRASQRDTPRGMPSAHLPPSRLRAVPAEPRPDRQPRFRRTPDHAGAPGGIARRHGAAAAVAADPAAVHGRAGRRDRAVPLLHRLQRRGAGAGGARGPAQRVRRLCRIRGPRAARRHTRPQRRRHLRSIDPDHGRRRAT